MYSAILFHKFNTANGNIFCPAELHFDLPEPGTSHNSKVLVSPTTDWKYFNPTYIHYDREDLSQLVQGVELTVRTYSFGKIVLKDLVTAINKEFNLHLVEDIDYTPALLVSAATPFEYTLEVNEKTSYDYIGKLTVMVKILPH